MSQTLHIEISDEAFHALSRHASQIGQTPTLLIKQLLEQRYLRQQAAEVQTSKIDPSTFFGSVDLGYPAGSDNQTIDQDIAKAC